MHELSVATHIVEAVVSELAEVAGPVLSVRIRVGALSGVLPEALQFAWDPAAQDTILQGSILEIERVAARVHCRRCQLEKDIGEDLRMICPDCGLATYELIAGRELEILSVEIGDDESVETN
jgi:hydrogenase nickel incorporation protein HypA/HybF